jgi:hypothetical protein
MAMPAVCWGKLHETLRDCDIALLDAATFLP